MRNLMGKRTLLYGLRRPGIGVLLLLIFLLISLPASANSGSPQISIIGPKNGSTNSAGDVKVYVAVQNFNLVLNNTSFKFNSLPYNRDHGNEEGACS